MNADDERDHDEEAANWREMQADEDPGDHPDEMHATPGTYTEQDSTSLAGLDAALVDAGVSSADVVDFTTGYNA